MNNRLRTGLRFLPALLLGAGLLACGGSAASTPVTPTTSARGAVEQFMLAVADSNLAKMAALWGTSSGSAARTGQPSDYERRIIVMQAYLQSESHRIVSDLPDGGEDRHAVQVELRRQLCTKLVPFSVIKTADGSWLVNQVDLTAAGNPARACVPGGEQDTTASP